MNRIIFILFAGFWISAFFRCTIAPKTVRVNISEPPFEKLSEYNFFVKKLSGLQPNEGVLPYDLNSPLFSDYAKKSRFVWMPSGKPAAYHPDKVLEFPKGAVLIKNFFYENDETDPDAGRRIIETRLLVHREAGWEAHSYVWNESQTEAILDIVGDIVKVNWKDSKGERRQVNYIIPNKNQCKGCHSYDEKLEPIGPKIRNLNKPFAYVGGEKNQLEKWAKVGYLSGFEISEDHPKTAEWNNPSDSLHHRAMAYLDINCGHCHNPHGPGGTTGLNLVYDAPVDLNLGVNKPPVAAGRASGGYDYSIVKGSPEISIMVHRMASDEPGVMMPELGRTTVHEEGVALIREWIAEME